MNYKEKFRTYLKEDEFKITIFKNKVNVVSYESIGHFDSNKVMIRYNEGTIVINGDNLVVSKLLNDEVLVIGIIKSVELR